MSLHPRRVPDIPEETAVIARAAFPKEDVYMQMRDALGSIYEDEQFTHLYAADGQAGFSP